MAEFLQHCATPELNLFISRFAAQLARGDETLARDLHAHGWAYVGMALPGQAQQGLEDVAVTAMCSYMRRRAAGGELTQQDVITWHRGVCRPAPWAFLYGRRM